MSALLAVSCGYVGLGDEQSDVGFDWVDAPSSGGASGPDVDVRADGGSSVSGGKGDTGGARATGGDSSTGGDRASGGTESMGGAWGLGGFGGAWGGASPDADCPPGESCNWQCMESACELSCGEDSSCSIDVAQAQRVALGCEQGATCVARGGLAPSLTFACDGPGTCELGCGAASICHAQCTGTGSCEFDCEGASPCSMQCAGPGACLLRDAPSDQLVCNGVRRSCGEGVTTCNSPCPVAL